MAQTRTYPPGRQDFQEGPFSPSKLNERGVKRRMAYSVATSRHCALSRRAAWRRHDERRSPSLPNSQVPEANATMIRLKEA